MKTRDKALWFAAMMLVVLFVMNMSVDLRLSAFFPGSVTHVSVFNSLAAAAFFTLPYFVVAPRWRWTLWIVLGTEAAVLFTSSVYLGVFGDFYSLAGVDVTALFSGMVARSTTQAVGWADLIYLLPLVLVCPYRKWRTEILTTPCRRWMRWGSGVAVVGIPLMLFGLFVRRETKNDIWSSDTQTSLKARVIKNYSQLRMPVYKHSLWSAGSSVYLSAGLVADFFPPKDTLTLEELEQIHAMLDATDRPLPPETADTLKANRHKNLFLIIVESLNTRVISTEAGRKAAPVLTGLLNDTGTVWADSILTRVGHTMSADGQLLINTGLYPLITRPASPAVLKGDYPSLAKALGDHLSVEAICEQKEFYSHDVTSRTYGYDSIFDRLTASPEGYEYEADTRLFKAVEKVVSTLLAPSCSPIFLEITTLGMHCPYTPENEAMRLDVADPVFKGLDERGLVYLNKVKSLDTALGGFLEWLKREGLYDNSVIVIVADHSPLAAYLPEQVHSPYIPFIALNTGLTRHVSSPRRQVDIFPTILDLMGVESYVIPQTGLPYRGLGVSMLRDPLPHSDAEAALGEKMIYSGYFR